MSAEIIIAVLAAHPSGSWVDKDGACSGSKVVCDGAECVWQVDLDGHSGTTRRVLFPAHFAEELAKRGIGSIALAKADALREAQVSLGEHGPLQLAAELSAAEDNYRATAGLPAI